MKNRLELLLGFVLVGTLIGAVYLQPERTKPPAKPLLAAEQNAAQKNSFAVVNVRVFDGETLLPNATVVVIDGLIAKIEPAGAPIPADIAQIDGAGKTLLPGLIDAHTHTWGNAARDALRFGVTTELEMMGGANRAATNRAQRESLAFTDQADVWSAGSAVTVPNGHGTQFGLPVPTLAAQDDTADFVSARAAEGSDFIKLIVEDLSAYPGRKPMPTLNSAQIKAAIAAAHAAKKMALVHVSLKASASEVIAAGADGLVHIFANRAVDAEFIQLAAQRRAFVVPTLSVIASFAKTGASEAIANDKFLTIALTSEQRQSLMVQPWLGMAQPEVFARALANVAALHKGGVRILAGTDAGNPGTAHGASMHGELALLVQAGLTPTQALSAATAHTASAFGLADRGRIRTGLRADLLLVDGDPSLDILATRRIVQVWKNGFAVQRSVSALLTQKISEQNLIGSFDGPQISAPFGTWMATTDQMADGKSTGQIKLAASGAKASAGALHISGTINAGFAYPWSGAMFMAADAMAAVDASDKSELVFYTRGDGREYRVMLFSGESASGIPVTQSFKTTADWQEIKLPLADFAGADLTNLRGLAWTADAPEGSFEFWIDEVQLRE